MLTVQRIEELRRHANQCRTVLTNNSGSQIEGQILRTVAVLCEAVADSMEIRRSVAALDNVNG